MHVAPWFWFAAITLIAWGIVGLLQKLSTNYISAESSLIWLVVGFLLLEPLLYPGKAVLHYSGWNLMWALLSGILNALGAWALFAAMKSGGKASIISPLTALYPPRWNRFAFSAQIIHRENLGICICPIMLRRQPFVIHASVGQPNICVTHCVVKEHLDLHFAGINCGVRLFSYADPQRQICLRVGVGRFSGLHIRYSERRGWPRF